MRLIFNRENEIQHNKYTLVMLGLSLISEHKHHRVC